MKMELVFKRLGNSAGLTFPAAFLREHGVREGQTVVVESADDVTITLQPKAIRKRYTAAQLNAQCDLKAAMPSDLVAWERAPGVGSEAPCHRRAVASRSGKAISCSPSPLRRQEAKSGGSGQCSSCRTRSSIALGGHWGLRLRRVG